MGADLTITKSGRYFREGYGGGGPWRVIGMSYWAMSKAFEDQNLFTKEGNVSFKGVQFIVGMLEKRPLKREMFDKEWKDNEKRFPSPLGFETYELEMKRPEVQMEEYWQHAKERDKEMREFWKEALRLKSTVVWSV